MLHLSSSLVDPLLSVLILIGVDVLAGILVSISKATFNLSKIGSFIVSSILPYVGGLVLLGVLAMNNPAFAAAFTVSCAAADAKFLGDVYGKLAALGVSTPQQPPTKAA